ncbi:hypothetical protein F5Y14DRAFT_463073 [Nemania sp. NC0429]|nr:hypothetical protein F5Y14DRAFT_463073 [Nemania sp. NC0429]
MAKNRRRAKSVLEFLTAKNPTIVPVKEGKVTNTSRPGYYCPVAVRHWDEFDYETLETIFGGDLMREAQKTRSNLPHYPYLDEDIDLRLGKGEPITRSLISKWNHTIVLASLRAVQDAFHPCLWRDKTGQKPKVLQSDTAAENGEEASSTNGKERSKRSRQPDGGSVLLREIMLKKSGERFPKEYKPASNWNSKKLRNGELTNKETGEWLDGIKAAILDSRFCAVSIDDDPSTFSQLLEKIKWDGLMEFVSIPWANGCDDYHHNYKKLTVNLALWFTHVLAGNHYKLDWKYRKLYDEELAQTLQEPDHDVKEDDRKSGSTSTSRRDRDVLSSQTNGTGKRKRQKPERTQESFQDHTQPHEEQEQDTAQFSFYETSAAPLTIPADHYAAGTQHESEGSSDDESDSPPLKRRLRYTQ